MQLVCELNLSPKSNILSTILQIVVSTKSPKSDKQYVWEAVADSSSYVIKEETDPEKMLTRGTQITLFLRVYDPDIVMKYLDLYFLHWQHRSYILINFVA